ncbi:MAG: hypothetical protein ACK5JI_05350 [Azonexus sp.]
MTDHTDDDLAGTRAALNPMLDAVASILPWVSQTQAARCPPELNKRWQAAWTEFAAARREDGGDFVRFRRGVMQIMSVALETGDADCLGLAESLASTADHLEHRTPGNRLQAALDALCEVMADTAEKHLPQGLEHPHLNERLRHFQERLETALRPSGKPGERSDVLDRLFVEDAEERLAHMREALETLPIDIYGIAEECEALIQHAEQIDMWGIYHLGRAVQQLVLQLYDASEADQDRAAHAIRAQLDLIEQALRAIEC